MSTKYSDNEKFERRLERALDVPVPRDLVDDLKRIPDARRHRPRLRYFAMAASLLIAVSAVLVVWRLDLGGEPIEEYVANHYFHDGPMVLERGAGQTGFDVSALLDEFELTMADAVAGKVGFMMVCPTPEGVGLHFVVHTENGPITVLIMPDTSVDDGMRFAFDGFHAELVSLERGSAAIIGRQDQEIGFMHETIRQSIRPRAITS